MEPKSRSVGFASMDRHKQREIARKGGVAAHRKGTAHEFTAEEARNAGRKGGQQVSVDRAHMIEIGRVGGLKSAERRRNRAAPSSSTAAEVHSTSESEAMKAGSDTESWK
jgi:general stress protein YciG